MTTYTGEGNTETINLGWDSVSNIIGVVVKSKTNSYFLTYYYSSKSLDLVFGK